MNLLEDRAVEKQKSCAIKTMGLTTTTLKKKHKVMAVIALRKDVTKIDTNGPSFTFKEVCCVQRARI